MPDGNEFLEMRLAQGGRIVPHGLDDALPGFTTATDAARRELLALSRAVLGCVEAYAGMQHALVCIRWRMHDICLRMHDATRSCMEACRHVTRRSRAPPEP